MTFIPPVSSSSAAGDSAAADTTTRTTTKTLGQDDFLKLLVAQMSSQDPLNPQKDTEFIAQMAQFSSLEQSRSMQQDVAALRGQQDLSQAYSLLGQDVSVQVDKDMMDEGTVEAVTVTAGKPQIIVNGTGYDLSDVLSVTRPATQTSPAPVPSP